MEAIAAFSLACNVIQIVDFGFKLVAAGREIYKTRAVSANAHLEEVASPIKSICDGLSFNSTENQIPPEDQTLRDVATNAVTTAKKLLVVLDAMKLKGQNRRVGAAISRAIKTTNKESELEPRRRELASYQ
jgi:hypothetical protein